MRTALLVALSTAVVASGAAKWKLPPVPKKPEGTCPPLVDAGNGPLEYTAPACLLYLRGRELRLMSALLHQSAGCKVDVDQEVRAVEKAGAAVERCLDAVSPRKR